MVEMNEPSNVEENSITMLRNYNFIGSGIHFWPIVNGIEVSALYPNEHISFQLDSGKHRLGVRCYHLFTPMVFEDELEISIIKNNQRFFLLSFDPFFGCAEIEEIEEEEATNRLSDSKRIPTGKISSCGGGNTSLEDYEHELCFSSAIP